MIRTTHFIIAFNLFFLLACSTEPQEEENQPRLTDPQVQSENEEKVNDESVNHFIKTMNDLLQKRPNEPNVETVCTYCYAITEQDLEACDSCGMAPIRGTYVLSHEDLRTLNTTICLSCSEIIPELAKTCKFCMALQ